MMDRDSALVILGFSLMALGAITLPVEYLPHRNTISGRLVVGALMVAFGGALLGRQFLA